MNPSSSIDHSHPTIAAFVSKHLKEGLDNTSAAQALYLSVRDGFRYNPFDIHLDFDRLQVSSLFGREHGHCVDKALMLVACLRHARIPAKLGLARVKNHMGTSRLEEVLRTNVLTPHGYTAVFLNEKWVKCTPAFDNLLCQKLGVAPLEWDGKEDSLFQAFDGKTGGFMEYLEDYGVFEEVPQTFIRQNMMEYYPHMFDANGHWRKEAQGL